MIRQTIALFLFVATTSSLQGQSLDIGGIEIRLGQSQESVLTQLGAVYRLQNMPVSGDYKWWSVYRKDASSGEIDVGSFWLKNGVVINIEKEWQFGPDKSPHDLFNTALADAKRLGGKQCTFGLEEIDKQYGVTGYTTTCGRFQLAYQIPAKTPQNVVYGAMI